MGEEGSTRQTSRHRSSCFRVCWGKVALCKEREFEVEGVDRGSFSPRVLLLLFIFVPLWVPSTKKVEVATTLTSLIPFTKHFEFCHCYVVACMSWLPLIYTYPYLLSMPTNCAKISHDPLRRWTPVRISIITVENITTFSLSKRKSWECGCGSLAEQYQNLTTCSQAVAYKHI